MIVGPPISPRRCATAKPSIPGMLASRRTSANGRPARFAADTASTASRPFSTVVGCIRQRLTCSVRIRRLVPLSSTTSTGRFASTGSGPALGQSPSAVTSNAAVNENVLPASGSLSTQDPSAHQADQRSTASPAPAAPFRFTAAFDVTALRRTAPAAAGAEPRPTFRVLIVDDNVQSIAGFSRNRAHALATCAPQRSTGRRGARGRCEARAHGNPFSLVLLDANMPDRDGFSVAEEIATGRNWRRHADDAHLVGRLTVTCALPRSEIAAFLTSSRSASAICSGRSAGSAEPGRRASRGAGAGAAVAPEHPARRRQRRQPARGARAAGKRGHQVDRRRQRPGGARRRSSTSTSTSC